MDIYIHIKGNNPIRIAWTCSFLPRIGEHLFINDFCSDAIVLEDTLIVEDIQWHNIEKEICASLFMGYDPIENDDRDLKSVNLN
ncbi:MAG: hypothetical protein WCJ72_04815 [Chryseobacterium sp.]